MNLISTIKSFFNYFTLYAGSGGGSSAPTDQKITTTSIPDYARPYVEKSLGQAAALTDINQNPYQPYGGQQVAAFSPLQAQAMQNISGQTPAAQLTEASNIASQVGQYALQTPEQARQLQNQALGYGAQGANLGILGGGMYGAQAAGAGSNYANLATSPGAVSSYMSPYMQNAVDVQKQEAIRDYQKTMPVLGAQAVKSGAFGGSRQAITEAEAQRNVNQQLANIQATGSQQAYDRAIQSMQFGSNLGLQGLQTGLQGVNTQLAGTSQGMQGVQGAVGAGQYGLAGLGTAGQAASTLGALGQTQFGQEMAINEAQMRAGALQQGQVQRGLDIAYQQYQDQLNYPYKQLAFQSDMFRGLPLSQGATTMYQNTGAMAPQLLGAGLAAYGASTRAKNGGVMKSYAEGGIAQVDPSVPSAIGPQALSSRLAKLSDEQLMAYARTVKDAVALAEVKGEIQRRQEARQPQGQVPAGTVAQQMAPQESAQPVMAGGGIVALRNGGETEFERDLAARKEAVKLEDERAGILRPLAKTAGPLGYFTASPENRAVARGTLSELQNAPMEDVRAYRDTGAIPRSEDPAGSPAQMAALEASNAREAERRQANVQALAQASTADSADPMGGPAAVPPPPPPTEYAEEGASPVTGTAPAGTPRVGIAAPGVAPAAPAGQAPVGGAPTASSGIVSSNKAPAAMTGGAVPVPNAGDPMGWGAYKANVEELSKLDPEQKAILDDMRKRTERKMSRAEKQEKNIMNDAMIAGGVAMMGGMNLSDGVRRMAAVGGQKYFESSNAASKAIEAADDAQSAFDQYQLSLKQGNKKVAADMYGKYFNAMTDLQGKIQSASISAAASAAATAENRAARLQMHEADLAQRAFQNAETIRVREAQIQQNERQFIESMKEKGETARGNEFIRLQTLKQEALAKADAARNKIISSAERDPLRLQLYGVPENKLTPEQKKQKNLLETRLSRDLENASKPYMDEFAKIVDRQSTIMGLSPVSTGNIPTYDPATGKFK